MMAPVGTPDAVIVVLIETLAEPSTDALPTTAPVSETVRGVTQATAFPSVRPVPP